MDAVLLEEILTNIKINISIEDTTIYDNKLKNRIKSTASNLSPMIPLPTITDSWFNEYCDILTYECVKVLDLDVNFTNIVSMSLTAKVELRERKPWLN